MRKFIQFSLATVSVLFLVACSTTNNKAEDLELDLDLKGSVDGKKIGIDDDGDVIIQSETDASDELRTQTWVNSKLEDDISREYIDLKRCREDLADPRLGGSGEVTKIPEVDNLKSANEVKEKFGIDEDGNLKVVKKEYFMEKLRKERKYEKSLKNMKKILAKNNESCQRHMGRARLSQGLPARRYEATGYFTSDGVWIGTEKAERSLDDAFERSAKAQKKTTVK